MPADLAFHEADALSLQGVQQDVAGFAGAGGRVQRVQHLLHVVSVSHFDDVIAEGFRLGVNVAQAHDLVIGAVDLHAVMSLGEDGVSLQASEDIALMRVLPNMTVLVPSDANECYQCVEAAAQIEGPVYIRTSRLATPVYDPRPFTVGKGTVIRDGKDCAIFTCGIMLEHVLEAAELLAARGIDAAIVSFHTLKPFDEELARAYTARCGKVFTVEEHSVIGGLGDTVASAIIGNGVKHFEKIGINDIFGQSGKPADLLAEYGLTGQQIADRIAGAF